MPDQYHDVDGNPIVVNAKPTYHDFAGNPVQTQPYKDPITTATEKVAPWLGRAATEALPAIGSFAGPGGTLIGTGISQMMKRSRPDLFGEQQRDFNGDSLVNAGKELLLNNVLPAGLGKLGGLALKTDMQGIGATVASKLSNFPAVREGVVKQLTQQINKRLYPESQVIEQGAENASGRLGEMQDTISSLKEQYPDLPPTKSLEIVGGKPQVVETPGGPHPQVQAAMDHLGDVFGRNRVGGMLLRMQKEATAFDGDIARTQAYKQISSTTLSDIVHVQNAKMTAGPQFTNDIAVNKILTGAGDPTGGTIDATKALGELGGKNSEIYKEAMNPASYDSLNKMLVKMKGLEDHNITDTIISFSSRRLVWNLAGGAGLGALAGHPITGILGGAAAETPVLTNLMLRKIMQNPETVKLVTLAMETPKAAPQAGFLQKALTQVLPRIIQGEADLAAMPQR
jgi:hypothetical protein